MEYSIKNDNYRNFNVYEINKLRARAYTLPYKSRAKLQRTNCLTERYGSDCVRVLSGEWDFKYYDKTSIVPNVFDTERVQFDKITVPSTWQRTGYREPVYLNTRYEFKLFPPELPEEVAVGVYRKSIEISDVKKTFILSFLGVASSLDLYVNGEFVGYSEGSHNTAEFDITDFCKKGENELLAVVHKWSTGTYLECQDMFRENGIFRDVLLYEYGECFIYDYEIKTSPAGASKYNLDVCAEVFGSVGGCTVSLELFDDKKKFLSQEVPACDFTRFGFKNLEVKQWSAEIPNVYETYLTLKKNGETLYTLRFYIGFKSIEILNDVFKFNGKAIKFKGVNHHDSNPKTGYVMSADDIKKDLDIMKELNVNAIRTSHYPPDEMLLSLADIMGFYVVDEADIETHGTGSLGPNSVYRPNYLSNDLNWAPRYLDRVSRMYYRDRSHPCVTMWSLGNESGGYKCQDKCYDFLKEVCPEIPVHYEAAIRTRRVAYDVISEMYTSSGKCEKTGERTRGQKYIGKPFFLCEYCHAMGVGPGCLEDYWKIFYKYDSLMGGCIWEFCDHAVWHDLTDKKCKYEYEYTYGGDHKEEMHDNNFCVDGLVYPDRRLHTGALEMKAVYRPVRCERINGNQFKFTNTNRFKSSGYITINWELCKNCESVKSGKINIDILPCRSEIVSIPLADMSENADYQLNISYTDDTDFEIASEQIILKDVPFKAPIAANGTLTVMESDENIGVSFDGGKTVFSKKTGEMLSLEKGKTELINSSPADGVRGFLPNVFRAPIDNDSHGGTPKWNAKRLENAKAEFKSIKYKKTAGTVEIKAEYEIVSGGKKLYVSEISYSIYPSGVIGITASLEKKLFGNDDIPRFGLTSELSRELTNVEYYGKGPYENVCDMNAHTRVGIFRSTVAEMHEPYIMPQDNGNHGGTKYLRLTNADGKGIEFIGLPKFSFSVHNYTQKALTKAQHREELPVQRTTFVSLDGFYRGVGSNSCGPDTLPQYRFSVDGGISFRFAIKPIV